jgi:hypothetical protein
VLVRIVKRLDRDELDELDLRRFKVGDTYDVTAQLGMLLVVGGYAEVVRGFERTEAADGPRRKMRRK